MRSDWFGEKGVTTLPSVYKLSFCHIVVKNTVGKYEA